ESLAPAALLILFPLEGRRNRDNFSVSGRAGKNIVARPAQTGRHSGLLCFCEDVCRCSPTTSKDRCRPDNPVRLPGFRKSTELSTKPFYDIQDGTFVKRNDTTSP